MLTTLLSGGSFLSVLYTFLALAIVLFTGIPFHEFSHGWTAERLGDRTARLSGRLTVNPFAHFDAFGTIMLFLVGFGFAKPVPVNPNNFKIKSKKLGMALVALAGPASNVLVALAFVILMQLSSLLFAVAGLDHTLYYVLWQVFALAAQVNLGLAVFNLIPLPPLDGWRILGIFLPLKWQYALDRYQLYITLGLFILLSTNILSTPLQIAEGWLFELLYNITLPIASGFGLAV